MHPVACAAGCKCLEHVRTLLSEPSCRRCPVPRAWCALSPAPIRSCRLGHSPARTPTHGADACCPSICACGSDCVLGPEGAMLSDRNDALSGSADHGCLHSSPGGAPGAPAPAPWSLMCEDASRWPLAAGAAHLGAARCRRSGKRRAGHNGDDCSGVDLLTRSPAGRRVSTGSQDRACDGSWERACATSPSREGASPLARARSRLGNIAPHAGLVFSARDPRLGDGWVA